MTPEFAALLALNALVLTGAFFFVRRLLDDAQAQRDGLVADHAAQRAEWAAQRDGDTAARDARERALLDRLMANDWATYKTHVMQTEAGPTRQVIDDENEARYAAEHGLTLVEGGGGEDDEDMEQTA